MFTPISTPSASPIPGVNNTPTAQNAADAQADRFLKLLVAQLNNQDPMNPMDNAQMTSQMAQINTVSGIQQLNETIKSMAAQSSSLQMMQGASMIGREVLTEGNTLAITGGVGKGAIDLAGDASQVTVQVVSPGGALLDTLNLGSAPQGRLSFDWDASNYQGSGNPQFKVLATMGNKAIAHTPLQRSMVEAISSDAGSLNLSLQGGGTLPYASIRAIL